MASTPDTDVLIIGAGMSGLGLAVQLTKKFPSAQFELIEKTNDVGGTWLVNTYPGCGCDVVSHFYSYSFELNPDWTQKYSMQSEIQGYFRNVAEKYDIIRHVKFQSIVEGTRWDESSDTWVVTIRDLKTGNAQTRRSRFVVSAVGSLSVPQNCEIPGSENFRGHLFHSARWDHSFDWKDKEAVVLGNGCSATQFVPVMSAGENAVKKITQFSRQAHYLAERDNPTYSENFKRVMRYVPLVMRLYRANVYWGMEKDFLGFNIESGRGIRDELAEENKEYVMKNAPEKYWDALIPKHEIGCKRKVLDTDYLASLHRPNVELIPNDPVEEITESGVRTKSGRAIDADAIILATGFQTHKMLFPMEMIGENDVSLNDHWNATSQGAPQAYLGTCVPGFPNFFILMGPNTVTGHLSVIYTVECQINFSVRLMAPVLQSLHPSLTSSVLPNPMALFSPKTTSVAVTHQAAQADSAWVQSEARKLVWSSGCTTWALDPSTGLNVMMYPDWQFAFWLRSIFYPRKDFVYRAEIPEGSKIASKAGRKRTTLRVTSPAWAWLETSTLIAGLAGCGFLLSRYVNRQDAKNVLWHVVHRSKELIGRS